ncbi:sodium-dependent phosphate transport protein 2B-like [Saccostrea echinata]|uniref:sodium-dependent phosphate transport protein 2B-like n=1 Tax=Saccostrea echinata TaxID=191078 RepID=UPI002A832D78|nr:sodium-dependent phosphate transport protein 2B-like [Saccostrea echinata]
MSQYNGSPPPYSEKPGELDEKYGHSQVNGDKPLDKGEINDKDGSTKGQTTIQMNGYENKGFDGTDEKLDISPEKEEDPWALPELKDTGIPWDELDFSGKVLRVVWTTVRVILFLTCLYVFFCSLDFLSSAFKLLGGKAAGEVFRSNVVLRNPVCGVMIGVLSTVLVQSSSTSTSIVVSMVAADILDVGEAIPIVMGANIGTSVTNTIVSLGQITDVSDFRRAFAGATVHDMFNWLAVIVLLPLELITGYLYHLSGAIVDSMHLKTYEDANKDLLKTITKPFTKMIVEVDSKQINKIVTDGKEVDSLLKTCCKSKTVMAKNATGFEFEEKICTKNCTHLFMDTGLSDAAIGSIMLVVALILLCLCLFGIVKILNSLLKGNIRKVIKKFVNYEFPGKAAYFTGYIAIVIGTGLTILVQSSSIFTSTMTPLVGVGVIGIDRMYPLTLGSNIGTTTTGILAALATDTSDGIEHLKNSLQVSMCHLFFNLSGIILFYPLKFMRFPIPLAKFLGNTTAKYRWFAIFYLILMFFVFPLLVFGISLAGIEVLAGIGIPFICVLFIIGIIKVLQNKKPNLLPKKLQNWKFLPVYFRSLEPLDRLFSKLCGCCKMCKKEKHTPKGDLEKQMNTKL